MTNINGEFLQDTLKGLNGDRKSLPCKYFYDATGSDLFEQICELDEYYLTRVELRIMKEHAKSIAAQIGHQVMLVEYGSGSSIKTRILLDALEQPVAYVPIDISEEHLAMTAAELQAAYPEVEISPVVADFTAAFELPDSKTAASQVAIYFPGSTIGNFTEAQASELLGVMANILEDQGGLLIGIDLQKDPAVIEAAYNDAQGITAAFNLNILNRINAELRGDFRLEDFRHRAVYDNQFHRIEISIVSLRDQQVKIADQVFALKKNEEILTEYSHKYTIDGFARLAAQHGFALHQSWTDHQERFAVLYLALDA